MFFKPTPILLTAGVAIVALVLGLATGNDLFVEHSIGGIIYLAVFDVLRIMDGSR